MKLCIQSGGIFGHYSLEEGYLAAKKAGFDSIDLNIDTEFDRNKLRNHRGEGLCIFEKSIPEIMAHFKRELDAIKAAGLYVYQAHSPFPSYMKDIPDFLDYCIEIHKKCLEFCAEIGCRRLIVHGVALSRDDVNHTQADIDAVNEKLYTGLIETAKQTGVTVCLENLFYGYDGTIYGGHCSDPHEAAVFIDHLNELAGEECFGLCVDTGHLNLIGREQYAYIKYLGKRIKAFHVHDNDGKSDLHLAPYTGTINWEGFCRAVREIGYRDDLDFETFRQIGKNRMPEDRMAFPWLRLIAETGKVFASKIEEE